VIQTFGLGLFEPITSSELEEIENFFRGRDAPVFHEVSPLAGIALFGLLNGRGYQPVELTSVMHCIQDRLAVNVGMPMLL